MSKFKDTLRTYTPHVILDLVGRYNVIKNTDTFSKRPVYTVFKLARWMIYTWTKRDIAFTTPDGTRFVSMPFNLSSFLVCFENYRDPSMQAFMMRRLKSDAVFVDAGANIGTYTIRAGQLLTKGTVIVFEAHPLIYTYLQKNIDLNNLKNVKAFNIALGAQEGSIEMSYTSANAGQTHVAVPGEEKVQVPLETLDSCLSKLAVKRVDYLKIDVEGFELPLLQGAQDIIKKSKDIVIQTELNEGNAQRYGNSIVNLIDLLMGWGFTPHSVGSNGKTQKVGRDYLMKDCDILWWREK